MRIGIYPSDNGGCGHYRMIWPGEAAARLGHDVTVIEPGGPDSVIRMKLQDVGKVESPGRHGRVRRQTVSDVLGVEPPPYDVVVLQRPLSRLLALAIPHLQDHGIAVVVEVDDDFTRIDPRNAAWPAVQPRLNPLSNYEWLRAAIDAADLVTVTTPALADVYGRGGGDVAILPNYLPPHAYREGRRPATDRPVLGWSGSLASHPVDLLEAAAGIRAACLTPECAGFRVVGSGKGVARQLGLPDSVSFDATGECPLEEWHAALDAIDVGVVPLKPSRFNEAKSWLKGLEYAARGIPSVASPTGPYRQFAALRGCQVAESPKDWRRRLTRLLADHRYREEAAEEAFAVAWSLRIDAHSQEWVDAWSLARAVRRAA